MKTKKTSFNLTKATLLLENEILNNMDISRVAFHRRAINYFLGNGGSIHPYLLIKDRSDPNYVHKDAMEQIYLDAERESALLKVSEKYDNCGITIVLFQALMTYCSVMAPIILGDEAVEKMFGE